MISIKDKQKTLFKRQDKLRNNPTESELIFKKRLDDLGIKYIFQKCFIAKDYYCIVDFYLPKPFKLCIEIDGGHHDESKQKAKDYYRTKYLTDIRGFKETRIKNKDVESFDLSFLLKS
jgi:very-short-patch-repair endonuclease